MSKPTPNERKLLVAYLNARSEARRAETPAEERSAQMRLAFTRGAALLYLRAQPESKRTRKLIKTVRQVERRSKRMVEVDTGYVPEHPDVLARAQVITARRTLLDAYETIVRAKYSDNDKADLAKQGKAIPNAKGDPSYPVDDIEDLKNAIQAVGLGGIDHDKIRKHLIAQAAKIPGGTALIPKTWNADGSLKKAA